MSVSTLSYLDQETSSYPQRREPSPLAHNRLLQNGAVRVREWYAPLVQALLHEAVGSGQEVLLIIDGTKSGGGHRLLMVAVGAETLTAPAWPSADILLLQMTNLVGVRDEVDFFDLLAVI